MRRTAGAIDITVSLSPDGTTFFELPESPVVFAGADDTVLRMDFEAKAIRLAGSNATAVTAIIWAVLGGRAHDLDVQSGCPRHQKKDQMRFHVGDTDSADPLVQDEAISFVLTREPGALAAAAVVARAIAARFSRQADKAVATCG